MLNLVIFGPPGVGKGTQSELLAERYPLTHISTGELLRNGQERLTPDEQREVSRINGGNLIPDSLAIAIINHHIERCNLSSGGLIFDGFPRTGAQAVELDRAMDARGMPINLMIALEGNQRELIQRLLTRGLTSGRADDQNVEIIQRRFAIYEQTSPLVLQHYEQQGKRFTVDAMGTAIEVFERICAVIDTVIAQPIAQAQTQTSHGRI